MENIKLIHFSGAPLDKILSVKQIGHPHFKPQGLWFSVEGNGDGWRDWCEGEKWGLDRLKHETEIVLAAGARILRLSNADEIDAFTKHYSEPADRDFRFIFRSINWSEVAETHQGIIIAPYIWERRLDDLANWYYAWDCASGCVWDAKAIAEVRPRVES